MVAQATSADGEMPMVSLQERLREISAGLGRDIPNDGFRILAADNVEGGINLSTEEGQQALEPLLSGIDLLILDNLSTLLPSRSESASDAWVPIQHRRSGSPAATANPMDSPNQDLPTPRGAYNIAKLRSGKIGESNISLAGTSIFRKSFIPNAFRDGLFGSETAFRIGIML